MLGYAVTYRAPLDRCQYELMQFRGKDRLTLPLQEDESAAEIFYEPLSEDDWVELSEVRDFLAQFEEATVRCCADQSSTLQIIVPWYNILMDHCDSSMKQANSESTLYDAAEEAKEN